MPKRKYAEGAPRARAALALAALCALLPTAPGAAAQTGRAPRPARFAQKSQARPAAKRGAAAARAVVPEETLLRIVEAEDERRWEESDLGSLLTDANPAVRRRAALAAGRIGDEGAVTRLATLLGGDADEGVRATAAFALGEVESGSGAGALLDALGRSKSPEVRARAVEALGKIAAALSDAKQDVKKNLGGAITSALAAEGRQARPNRLTVLLGLTAVLRARPEGGARAV